MSELERMKIALEAIYDELDYMMLFGKKKPIYGDKDIEDIQCTLPDSGDQV